MNIIHDLIFPNFCIGCGKEGKLLCDDCRKTSTVSIQKICPVCKLIDQPRNCAGSRLDNLWVLSHYQDFLVAESIHKIKYELTQDLINLKWGDYLVKFWQRFNSEISRDAIVIPVPLHRKRFLARGFNQSELVAQKLSKISGLVVNNKLLKRIIYNEPQVGLSGLERIDNVRGIFRVNFRELSNCWGKEIILIDDVYTTGSTLRECANELKKAGFSKVNGLVLAVD